MSGWASGPADAGTVQVRIQVVDVEPAALDMVVPTYIPAKDLSQRIARDANLGAYWPDGTRRLFWVRARGRIMGEDEKLDMLGVVNGELLHLLPQPPPNSGVIEQIPDFPSRNGYTAGGWLNITTNLLSLTAFIGLWTLGMSVDDRWYMALVPAILVALKGTSAGHFFWGGPGSSLKVPATGLLLYFPSMLIAFIPVFISGQDVVHIVLLLLLGTLSGVTGVFMGWLAWFGAVEPLPPEAAQKATETIQQATEVPCGICGQGVPLADLEIRYDCGFGCGRVFHSGCYRARASVARDDSCAVCGYQPQAGG